MVQRFGWLTVRVPTIDVSQDFVNRLRTSTINMHVRRNMHAPILQKWVIFQI
jgi:hypothetical protein